jgi:hypothetical protein
MRAVSVAADTKSRPTLSCFAELASTSSGVCVPIANGVDEQSRALDSLFTAADLFEFFGGVVAEKKVTAASEKIPGRGAVKVCYGRATATDSNGAPFPP